MRIKFNSLIKKTAGAGRCSFRVPAISILCVLSIAALYITASLSPVAARANARDVVVVVPQHATASQVGKILKQHRLIRNSLMFSLYARFTGMDGMIRAGQYRLSNSMPAPVILRELVEGRLLAEMVTVPEGFTTSQVAELLVSKGLADREKFISAAASEDFPYSFLEGLPEGERRLEGYLFPDTYQVIRGTEETAIINMMLQRFEREMAELDYPARARSMGLTVHQAVTFASMVEREAKIDEERPVIAGVIYNRLKMSMPLQIDATVQYALGSSRETLYYRDLEVDSPYNTYKNTGFPPGPIAMPGRVSLLAVVNPDRNDYLYYVAKEDGSHAFARTLAEHDANRERYQQ
ncbi:MAG TPA: endolytic transglycosylase MltG [Bacillota bacterium]|nr:endolytic transglycosylase MltG [Bacillota bacterium]